MARVLDLTDDAMIDEARAGDFIEKYELLRPIAQGGMGSVWAAKLHGPYAFEKLVAIKTVLPDLAGDEKVRARFLDEARIVSAIAHRNVAHVVDFLEREGALYIVMEWVDGVSLMWLHERLEKRGAQVSAGIALRILADVCAGLHAAHELKNGDGESYGLVHRDVSPHNVLVASDGAAKLIDFGVAKTRFRAACDSTLGQIRGRLSFMAPEQAQSEPLDRRADVWSIGACLFYLLTGHGPFGAGGRFEALRQLLRSAQPMPPPAYVHPSIARVLTGCLARRREDRFATAEQVAWSIEDALEDMGVAATSRDVAAFVDEQAGEEVRRRRHDIGRCMATGRSVAIPRELALIQTGSLSALRLPARVPRRRVAAAIVACTGLVVAAAGAIVASGAGAASFLPVSVGAAHPVATPSWTPPSEPVEAMPATAAPTHDEIPPVQPAQESHPQTKPRTPVRHATPLPRSRHERHGGPRK